jgi:hypothetical protein
VLNKKYTHNPLMSLWHRAGTIGAI